MMLWAMIFAALTGALLAGAEPTARRLARLLPGKRPNSCPQAVDNSNGSGKDGPLRRLGPAALAGLACALALGGTLGLVAGATLAALCLGLSARLEPRQVRLRRARLVADIPVALDLLSACLLGGTPWSTAVEAVARALGGPLGEELQAVSAQLRLGADPTQAWATLAREPALTQLGRTLSRASTSGSSLAPALARLARDQRRLARAQASARARTAGIRAVAPLGLCFLPAFVLLGIVPAVAGIASTVLLP